MCGPLEVITLRCGVRQTCYYELKLENPLDKRLRYKLEASTPEISFDGLFHEVLPETNVSFDNYSF